MPTLIAAGPGHTTGITLENNAFWRLQIGALGGEPPSIALIARYPPGSEANIVALVSSTVPFRSVTYEAVAKVAAVCLAGGTQEADIERMREGFHLFKNQAQAERQELFDQVIKEGTELIEAYWNLRKWLLEGAAQPLTLQVGDVTLLGRP